LRIHGLLSVVLRSGLEPALAHRGLHEPQQLRAQRIVVVGPQVITQLHGDVVWSKRGAPEHFTYQPLAAVTIDRPRCGLPAGDDAKTCIPLHIR